MTRKSPSPEPSDSSEPSGDPWAAFGYLVAGVAVYGLIGWGLATWLHAAYLIPIGILVGAALGLYLVFKRYGGAPKPLGDSITDALRTNDPQRPAPGRGDGPTRPDHRRDDRGETE
jgi:hypothetical protein